MELDAPSNSMIKHARISMLAYHHHVTSGRQKTTPAMTFGRAFHEALLEPESFAKNFVCLPSGKLTSREGKADWAIRSLGAADVIADIDTTLPADDLRAEVCAAIQSTGKTVLSASDMELMREQLKSLNRQEHRLARAILSRGQHELELRWEHGSLRPKAKLDGWDPESGILCDLKSCESATADGFRRTLYSYGYHYQAAYYARALRAHGEDPAPMVFVLAEKTAPWHWNVLGCSPDDIERADAHTERLLADIERCLDSGEWPGLMGDEPRIVCMRRSNDD